MMRKIINAGSANMRHYVVALLSIVICSFSLLWTPSALADYYYLKPGQSKTIAVPKDLDTVFVSNPAVADYKVVGEGKLVVYGRIAGYSDVTLYDKNSNVLNKISIEVDPVLADTSSRIKALYPNSKVKISKVSPVSTDGSGVYILTGTVPTQQAMDDIYRIVGQSVNGPSTEHKLSISSGSEGNTGGVTQEELPFMSYKTYTNVINRMVLPQTNQVNVRLTVVEVNKEFKDSLGIEWSNFIEGASQGAFALVGFKGLDRGNIHNAVKAVQNDQVARVLAQPNLTVLSGEVASFLVGGEIPISVRDPERNIITTSYKEYGIKLSIAARVETSKKIKLFLSNELSSMDTSYAKDLYSVPVFRTRRTSSTIELADGDSFAIAGLLNDSDMESLSKIPYIGEIPILGALVRNSATTRSKTELIVFATINLVKPTSSSANIEVPAFKKSNASKLFFNVGVDRKTIEGRLEKDTQLNHDSDVFLSRGGFAK